MNANRDGFFRKRGDGLFLDVDVYLGSIQSMNLSWHGQHFPDMIEKGWTWQQWSCWNATISFQYYDDATLSCEAEAHPFTQTNLHVTTTVRRRPSRLCVINIFTASTLRVVTLIVDGIEVGPAASTLREWLVKSFTKISTIMVMQLAPKKKTPHTASQSTGKPKRIVEAIL